MRKKPETHQAFYFLVLGGRVVVERLALSTICSAQVIRTGLASCLKRVVGYHKQQENNSKRQETTQPPGRIAPAAPPIA